MPNTHTSELAAELLRLLQDPAFRRRAVPPANFWSIVHYGAGSYENRYNRVVRWLLDPTENHGLGASVVNAVIALADDAPVVEVVGGRRVRTAVETPVPLATISGGRQTTGRIDVTLTDHENHVVVAVESKLASSAHDEQLSRYRSHIECDFADWRKYFIFLTETGEDADDDGWVDLTYAELSAIVRRVASECATSSEASHIINDFLADVERRGAGPADARIAALYFADHEQVKPTINRFAELITLVAADLEPEPAVFAESRIGRLREYVLATCGAAPTETGSPETVFAGLQSAFEAAGESSNTLVRTLTYVIEHAPHVGSQNHALLPGIKDFVHAYFAHVTGGAAPAARGVTVPVAAEHSVGGYLRHVQLNRGDKGVTFNAGVDGVSPFRVSGNAPSDFPTFVLHLGARPSECGILGHEVSKQGVEDWTAATLHTCIEAGLNRIAGASGKCGCGDLVSGSTAHQG